MCFHPLKAGRRPFALYEYLQRYAVSIPSRRVGDNTVIHVANNTVIVSIPSRRVGDGHKLPFADVRGWVSIPSRRVGDLLSW